MINMFNPKYQVSKEAHLLFFKQLIKNETKNIKPAWGLIWFWQKSPKGTCWNSIIQQFQVKLESKKK